jgi:hypothetical protein
VRYRAEPVGCEPQGVYRNGIPKHWPDERFDLIWVLVRQPGEELAYRFVSVPQMLLADDAETG